ncbi:MAG: DUF1376 domain-containing protein [Acidobacteria bacterium]|nr:DUF1376 domain-containing protein [Acidobacteriota bacterium]
MAKEKAPAFQFYPKDFLSDGRPAAMTAEEVGVYVRLLCFCWLDESVPDDAARCARMTGVTPARMTKLWPAVRACFSPVDGALRHGRLDAERDKQQAYATKQAENGRRGGRPPQKPKPNPTESQPITDGEAKKSSPVSDLRSATSNLQEQESPRPPSVPRAQPSPGWHDRHVRGFCDWKCLPAEFVTERADGDESAVVAWAEEVRAASEDVHGAVKPTAEPWDFWKACWKAAQPAQPTAQERQQYAQIRASIGPGQYGEVIPTLEEWVAKRRPSPLGFPVPLFTRERTVPA